MEDAAKALVEVGEIDKAIEFAERGSLMEIGFQAESCARYWCNIVREYRPADVVSVCRVVFDVFPSEEHATRLHEAAGQSWSTVEQQVLDALSRDPLHYVGFLLRGLGDPARAWSEAKRIDFNDMYLWSELVVAYQKTDPAAVIPVIEGLIEEDLRDAGVGNYRRAVKRLRQLRTTAKAARMEADFERYVACLREKHRNRPRFLTELDKAKLG